MCKNAETSRLQRSRSFNNCKRIQKADRVKQNVSEIEDIVKNDIKRERIGKWTI